MTSRMKRFLEQSIPILVCIIFALLVLIPVFYCFDLSFFTKKEYYAWPPKFLPKAIQWDNYTQALAYAPFFRYILNSVIVATGCMALQLVTGALAGYAFGVLKFCGKKILFILILATMMIPMQTVMVANYLTISKLHLLDSYPGLMAPYCASAFCVFNMRQAFRQFPRSIKEAADIDGCSKLRFFLSIGLPLVRPSLGALGIYSFIQVWNLYIWPFLITNSTEMRTVQVGLGMLNDTESPVSYGIIMAGASIVLIPTIMIFIFGQKQLINGIMSGSVKG